MSSPIRSSDGDHNPTGRTYRVSTEDARTEVAGCEERAKRTDRGGLRPAGRDVCLLLLPAASPP